MANERESEPNRGSTWWIALIAVGCVVLLPIFYVLSIGPMVMAADFGIIPPSFEPMLEIIYMPVVLLHEYTPLREPLEWYVELWA